MPITVRGTMTRIDGIPLDEGKTGASIIITTKELSKNLLMELSRLYEKEIFITFAYPEEDNQKDLFADEKQTGGEENDDRPLPFPERKEGVE